ncbi:MAG: hypothetical protein ACKVJG_10270 [Candidatus Latescibacterota bacterium]|jgi:hypothetical protein
MQKLLPKNVQNATDALTDAQREEISQLAEKAVGGDTEALVAFEEKAPFAGQYLAETMGDLGRQVRHKLLSTFIGDEGAHRRGVELASEELLVDLMGPSPTPVERLLSEQVVSCWIECSMVDQCTADKARSGDYTPTQLEFYHRWQARAQRRYLAACKALAQVRKLLGINVQINIADKQINVVQKERSRQND